MLLTIVVKDQTSSLDFYTKILGFEKIADYSPPGNPRWLTVGPKGQDIQFVLFQAGSYPDPNSPQNRWKPGPDVPAWTFQTDDCRKDFTLM
jgi:catechol 2,3-dioxygenase-like lactoylglutathione lyase family enzyme